MQQNVPFSIYRMYKQMWHVFPQSNNYGKKFHIKNKTTSSSAAIFIINFYEHTMNIKDNLLRNLVESKAYKMKYQNLKQFHSNKNLLS